MYSSDVFIMFVHFDHILLHLRYSFAIQYKNLYGKKMITNSLIIFISFEILNIMQYMCISLDWSYVSSTNPSI